MSDNQKQVKENGTLDSSSIEERLNKLKNNREKTLNDFKLAYRNIQSSDLDDLHKQKQSVNLKKLFENYISEKGDTTEEATRLLDNLNISSGKATFTFGVKKNKEYSWNEKGVMKKNIEKFLRSDVSLKELNNAQIGWLLSNVYLVGGEYVELFKNKIKNDPEGLIKIAKNWDSKKGKEKSISRILQVDAKYLNPMIKDLIGSIKEAVENNIDRFLKDSGVKDRKESERIKSKIKQVFSNFEKSANSEALPKLINGIGEAVSENNLASGPEEIANLAYNLIRLRGAESQMKLVLLKNENPKIISELEAIDSIKDPIKKTENYNVLKKKYQKDSQNLGIINEAIEIKQNEKKFIQSEKLLKEVKDDEKLSKKLVTLAKEGKTFNEIEKELENDIRIKKLEEKGKETKNSSNSNIIDNKIGLLKKSGDSTQVMIGELPIKIEQVRNGYTVDLGDNSKIKCSSKEQLQNVLDTCNYLTSLGLNSLISQMDRTINEIKNKSKSQSLALDIRKGFNRIELNLFLKAVGNVIFRNNGGNKDIPDFASAKTLEKMEEIFKMCGNGNYPKIESIMISQNIMDDGGVLKTTEFLRMV